MPDPLWYREAIVTDYLRTLVANALGLDPSAVDPEWPLADLGLDSLLAIEIKRELERELEISLRATVLFAHPTLDGLVPHLAARAGLTLDADDEALPEETARTAADSPELAGLVAEVARLSDDEITRMLERLTTGDGAA